MALTYSSHLQAFRVEPAQAMPEAMIQFVALAIKAAPDHRLILETRRPDMSLMYGAAWASTSEATRHDFPWPYQF